MTQAFTIQYAETYKSGHVAIRGVVKAAPTSQEAVDAFHTWSANRGMDVEFISVEALSRDEQNVYDEFQSGQASTVGD